MTNQPIDFSGRTPHRAQGERTFQEVNDLLKARGLAVCKTLLPGGRMQSGEWVCADLAGGKGRSLSVNVQEGVFKDFSGGEGGADFINLWAAVHGTSQHSAKLQAEDWLGLDRRDPPAARPMATEMRPWATAAPTAEPEMEIEEDEDPLWWRSLKVKAESKWDYVDADGVVFATIYRFRHPDDPTIKVIRPWDPAALIWQAPDGLRPLLYTPEIAAKAGEPVYLVEGEKCTDALGELFLLATTIMGGASAVAKTDWSLLAGRDVVTWRDNDKAGLAWEEKVHAALREVQAASVRAVVIPKGKPEKWDAADATPKERRTLTETALKAKPLHQSAPQLRISDWPADRFHGAAPERTFLVNEVFPANVYCVLAAQGDTGKGMMLLDLCLKVAGGAPPPGIYSPIVPKAFGATIVRFGRAVLLSAEDDMAELHRRMERLDPDGAMRKQAKDRLLVIPLPNVGGAQPMIRSTGKGPETTPEYERIRDQLGTLDDLALVVFDPLAAFVHADLNKDSAAAQRVGTEFASLATSLKATVIAAHHMRKAGGRETQITSLEQARDSIRGSTALIDSARMAYALWPTPEQDAKPILTGLGEKANGDSWRNRVASGGVVKSNGPADRTLRTYVRDPKSGLLLDQTRMLVSKQVEQRASLEDQLVAAIADGAVAGAPFKLTAPNDGLFAQIARLPQDLQVLGRDSLQALGNKLIKAKRIVKCVANGSRSRVWLDVPGGPFAKGDGIFETGAAPVEAGPSEAGE